MRIQVENRYTGGFIILCSEKKKNVFSVVSTVLPVLVIDKNNFTDLKTTTFTMVSKQKTKKKLFFLVFNRDIKRINKNDNNSTWSCCFILYEHFFFFRFKSIEVLPPEYSENTFFFFFYNYSRLQKTLLRRPIKAY